MNGFMISIVGFVIIAIYSTVILLIALFINRLTPSFRWKRVLFVPPIFILLSLPWVEEAWISWHFKEACKEAGIKVYRQVATEGYAEIVAADHKRKDTTLGVLFSDPAYQANFEKQGFRYKEELLSDGSAKHLERESGQVMVSFRDKPEARYYVKYAYQPTGFDHEEPLDWKLKKLERQVIDSQTGEVLGRKTNFIRIFPTHEALLAALLGPPIVWCPSPYPLPNINVRPYIPPPTLAPSVLKPISQQPEH